MIPCGPIALSLPGRVGHRGQAVGDPRLAAPAVDLGHGAGRAHARRSLPADEAGRGAAAAGLGHEQIAARAEGQMARAVEPGRDGATATAAAVVAAVRPGGRRDPQRDQQHDRQDRSTRM